MASVLQEVRTSLASLDPGFQVLNDYTGLESMKLSCAPAVAQLFDECTAKGVDTLHRVGLTPRKDIGLAVISAFHLGSQVTVLVHDSLLEAKSSLGLEPPDGA